MYQIDEVLSKIGDFECLTSKSTISIVGVLINDNNDIILRGSIPIEQYRSIKDDEFFQVIGEIGGINVTLLNCHIKNISIRGNGISASIDIYPTEVIVGHCYEGEIKTTRISTSIMALNYMFSSQTFSNSALFLQDSSITTKKLRMEEITATDEYGDLHIFQSLSSGWTRGEIKIIFKPIIEYKFSTPAPVMEAVGRLAAVRNLFSFFANSYLPLEDIHFTDDISNNECYLYLNNNEPYRTTHEPFIIMDSMIRTNFTEIWNKWLQMYNESRPIFALFFEVLCDRSTRINRFLNLVQAIEVYSCRYRGNDVIDVEKKNNPNWNDKKHSIHLKSRIEDILLFLDGVLEISNKPNRLAKSLTNMRNYFTHYNTTRYKEPTYDEIFSANRFLRFILLVTIYKSIGFTDEQINSVKKRSYLNGLSDDARIIEAYLTK